MIDEQTLILYYYDQRDGDDGLAPEDRRRVERALAEDDLLAARFEALKQSLDGFSADTVPEAPTHLRHQWHDAVKREARLERQRETSGTTRRPWGLWSGALAAVLALGIAIGLFLADLPGPGAPELAGSPADGPDIVANPGDTAGQDSTKSAAFARGLQVYLEDRQTDLVGFDERSVDEQAALVLRIVAQNRLFERAAEQQQAPEIARLLRAFEPLLLRLAAEDTTPEDAALLRRQLTFELNAVLTKLQQPPSKGTNT